MDKKTKIVATVSDRHCEVDFIKELYDAGMNVVRLNTAHQTQGDTLKVINNVRQVSDKIAFLLDTKGPEIRTAKTDFVYEVKKGDTVKVMGDSSKVTNEECVYLSHDNFVNEVEIGNQILVDDGELELIIKEKHGDYRYRASGKIRLLFLWKKCSAPLGLSLKARKLSLQERIITSA